MASFPSYSVSLISLLSLPSEVGREVRTNNDSLFLHQMQRRLPSKWANEVFTNTFVMRWRDSSWGNFTSSNSFPFQVVDSNNSTLTQWYI
jgi:hypothetical protein